MFIIRLLAGLSLAATLFLQTACSQGGVFIIDPLPGERDVMLSSSAIGGYNTAPAPLEVRVFMTVIASDSDSSQGHGMASLTKVELNFSDGTGWFDYATEFLQLMAAAPPLPGPADWFAHTYTEPGDYTISCRVTYWDGGVVYSSPMDPNATFHVLPPAGG